MEDLSKASNTSAMMRELIAAQKVPIQRTQLLAMLKQYKQNPNLIRADWEKIKTYYKYYKKSLTLRKKTPSKGKTTPKRNSPSISKIKIQTKCLPFKNNINTPLKKIKKHVPKRSFIPVGKENESNLIRDMHQSPYAKRMNMFET